MRSRVAPIAGVAVDSGHEPCIARPWPPVIQSRFLKERPASHNAVGVPLYLASGMPATDPDIDALRARLSQLRSANGWSYDELAARSGVGRSTLVALESGSPRRNPSKPATSGTITTWFRIAKAFELNLADLVEVLDRES